uniref:U-box domain-containing protein n=1 Tax=Aegilops tauschii subsp. strangulata TaxID=200361 RepID=A0A453BYJ3_AEGTS
GNGGAAGAGGGSIVLPVPDLHGDHAGPCDALVRDHLRPGKHRALGVHRRPRRVPDDQAAARRRRPGAHAQPHAPPAHPGLVRGARGREVPHPARSHRCRARGNHRGRGQAGARPAGGVPEGAQSQEDQMFGSVVDPPKASSPEDVALSILYSLRLSEGSWKRVLERGDNFLDTMASVLRRPSYLSRTHGIQLLKAAVSEMPPAQLTSASAELVEGVVSVVTDKLSGKAVKIALQVLCRLCLWGRNRVKAVEAGAVGALVELLLDECCGGSKRASELAIVVMDHLCGCAEGRLELVAHPAGLAVMARAVTRVSAAGTESAVRALHAVARHSATPTVLQEMLAVGVVGRLLFLVQTGAAGDRPRERAREMLKMHARVWRGSPCFTPQLNASYPS